jgi:hypothetical protein
MIARTLIAALAGALLTSPAIAAPAIKDPDTRAWWKIVETLSSDAYEGRDTGSPGHERSAEWVAARFKAAGLKPAGENGTYFQTFALHESAVTGADLAIVGAGKTTPLKFLHQFTVRAADDMPRAVDAPLIFAGYCRPEDLAGARGKAVVCFNTRRPGMTTAVGRTANVKAAGAVAILQVDDPHFTIEPPRWPSAYARSVSFSGEPAAPSDGLTVISLSAEALGAVIEGSGQPAQALLDAGGARAALPVFEIPARLRATFTVATRDYTTRNVLAVMPGSDPTLKAEHLVLSAHLDGYGYGEPVDGDKLYNGAFDDAAYVGTLIRFAERHKNKPLKRSVILAAFTGEEKGLLGSKWFVRHPTVPAQSLVANINLDQLRPLFPLKLMTVLALDESSLGDTARKIAADHGVRVQADPEPERNLLQRADHYPFMQAGVPATGFIFGYEPGTEAERRYREWYRVRYHRPQDDITQPLDLDAAGAFNRFFYDLAATVADTKERPTWRAGSAYASKP